MKINIEMNKIGELIKTGNILSIANNWRKKAQKIKTIKIMEGSFLIPQCHLR